MPSPLEVVLDPISLVVIAMYAGVWGWERLAPARVLPHVPWWQVRGLAAFVAYFFLSTYLPLAWDERLASYQLLDLSALGIAGGALVAVLAYEFALYFWHRSMHGSQTLWRVFHQMHHSAERVDVAGAFYFSVFDMVGWTALGSLVLTLGIGVAPQAITVFLLVTSFLGIFQHANIRTPRWLGYVIQRPESHARHHQRGLHTGNFSDLPVFDILFGTFHNPDRAPAQAGFYPGASARVLDMHAFRDVSKSRDAEGRVSVDPGPAMV